MKTILFTLLLAGTLAYGQDTPVANDNFAQAMNLDATVNGLAANASTVLTNNTDYSQIWTNETGEPEPPHHKPAVGGPYGTVGSTWYSIKTTQDTSIRLDTIGSTSMVKTSDGFIGPYDAWTPVTIYTGTDLQHLTQMKSDDGVTGHAQGALGFTAVANTQYWIQIGMEISQSFTGIVYPSLNLTIKRLAFTAPPQLALMPGPGYSPNIAGNRFTYQGICRGGAGNLTPYTQITHSGIVDAPESSAGSQTYPYANTPPGYLGFFAGTNTHLYPGENTIACWVQDEAGTKSNILSFHYFIQIRGQTNSSLTTISDPTKGTVSPAGKTIQMLTKMITITAKPKPGFIFSSWVASDGNGPITITNPTANPLKIAMSPELIVAASFEASPFTQFGQYYGSLAFGPNAYSQGTIKLNLTPQGYFSGYVTLRGKKFPIKASLNNQGRFSKTYVTGWGAPAQTFTLDLEQDFNSGIMFGTITEADGQVVAQWTGLPIPKRSKTDRCPIEGNYTMALLAENPVPVEGGTPPQGTGALFIKVAYNGTAIMVGKLADGTAFSTSYPIDSANQGDYYVPLYKAKGWITGTVEFRGLNDPNEPDLETAPEWSRAPGVAGTAWASGWDTVLNGIGSTFVNVKGTNVLPYESATLTVTELETLFTSPVTFTSTNGIKGVAGSLNKTFVKGGKKAFAGGYASGKIPASSLVEGAKGYFPWSGVVLQKQGVVLGYVIFKDGELRSGAVRVDGPQGE